MMSQGKNIITALTAGNATGPFVTIMLNTHVGHQNVEKDQLQFKNFAKEAKARFEKKYSEKAWIPFQEKIDALLADQDFWRRATTSVAIILNAEDTFVHRLAIRVDNQYYVADKPYLLAIIKNTQFNYDYFLLALNRDSFKLYRVSNRKLSAITLPEDAPDTLEKALGDELTGGNLNYSVKGGSGYNGGGKEGISYHGINTKDEEVEIDWTNYYQAVDAFLKELDNPENLPLYLFALPENQTMFKKVAKTPFYSDKASIAQSPAQLSDQDIESHLNEIADALTKEEIGKYNKAMDKKFIDQLVDIVPAAEEGRIGEMFIATSNLVDGFGEDPETEYDRRQVLNNIADNVIEKGGVVHVLEQTDAPDEKSLVAILRY
ncbi:hypothetical protein RU97_GL000219 [Enterococcus canis]|uniref:Bacterial archaeo-eukaryotic release factor family 6 domain-containing protein n=1 Tax=Enterococcus canis TaxID=214095 RepID=A0A1L8RJP1_9ENTE|nr:hypothetical protein [Enterococcus canis]OJG19986.1 hypothetical protein RU97_GL000219 [Enterococcus canis]